MRKIKKYCCYFFVIFGIGLGQYHGFLYSNRIVSKLGKAKTLGLAFLAILLLYLILSFATTLLMVEILLFFIFLLTGCVLPISIALQQSLTVTARGTMSFLSNAAMSAGTTMGGIIGGILLSHFPGFFGLTDLQPFPMCLSWGFISIAVFLKVQTLLASYKQKNLTKLKLKKSMQIAYSF